MDAVPEPLLPFRACPFGLCPSCPPGLPLPTSSHSGWISLPASWRAARWERGIRITGLAYIPRSGDSKRDSWRHQELSAQQRLIERPMGGGITARTRSRSSSLRIRGTISQKASLPSRRQLLQALALSRSFFLASVAWWAASMARGCAWVPFLSQ